MDSLDLNLEEILVNLLYLNARQAKVYEAKEAHLFGEKEVSLLLLVLLLFRSGHPVLLLLLIAKYLIFIC